MLIKKIYHGVLITIGFILSPLSWWNDLLVNFPLSYAIAFPFGLLSENLFIPMFIISYWLTNVIGFVMMHHGYKNLLNKAILKENTKKEFIRTIKISSIYTVLIIILIYFDILKFPEEFINKLIGT